MGVPLSVTTTVTKLVELAWLGSGVHENSAVVAVNGVSAAFVGPVNNEKVRANGGTLASTATFVTSRVAPGLTV